MNGFSPVIFTRIKGCAKTFVDLRKRRVFDVKLGRSEVSLRCYLSALPDKGNVKLMVSDLSEAYRSITRRYFPNAIIVADHFQLI